MLEEQLWSEWIKIMHGLVSSPDEAIRSDSLAILISIYDKHPDKLGDLTTKDIQEMQLGRLISATLPKAHFNLINYIFTVILSGDKAVRKVMEEN